MATATRPPEELNLSPFSHALSVLAGDVYLQLDAATQHRCQPVKVRPTSAPSLLEPLAGLNYSTWKPKGSFFFTLIKTARDTVVYSHDNDTAYVAAPCAKLAAACPPTTAVLAQWCLDRGLGGAVVPRLLVFDLLDGDPDPASRGAKLRALSPLLPLPLCTVQWAGQASALDKFAATLPHEVDYFLHLTDQALLPHRHMTIVLPAPPFSEADVVEAAAETPRE
jgi:hypothetical protein